MSTLHDRNQGTKPETPDYNLQRFLDEGLDALHPLPSHFKNPKVTELVFTRRNACHETTILHADNVAALVSATANPIPEDAPATGATVTFDADGSPTAGTVVIHRHSIRVSPQNFAPEVLGWLSKTSLAAAKTLRKLVPLLVLGLAALLPSPVDDLDDDDDDDEETEECTTNHHRPAFHFSRMNRHLIT